jgi:hypothetical protein
VTFASAGPAAGRVKMLLGPQRPDDTSRGCTMVLQAVPEDVKTRPRRWLCRVEDHTTFAYAHGHDFIRRSDNVVWAHLSDGQLISARSGTPLAYEVGSVFYDAATGEPLYYRPS